MSEKCCLQRCYRCRGVRIPVKGQHLLPANMNCILFNITEYEAYIDEERKTYYNVFNLPQKILNKFH